MALKGNLGEDVMTTIPSVSIPEGVSGNCRIETFNVSPDQSRLDAIRSMGRRFVPPGQYTRLLVNGRTMMSDTPDEKRDHWAAVRNAQGHCLVNGLGLGMVANAMALKDDVSRVTVVEISADVIGLVAHTLHKKIDVIHADAFDYVPPKGQRYGCVWHDIWQDICSDNLSEVARLKRKYGRRCDWQGAWAEDLMRWQRRRYA